MSQWWLVSWILRKNLMCYKTIFYIKRCIDSIFYENSLQTFAWAKHQCEELNMINEIWFSTDLHSISDGYHILCCWYAERAISNILDAISMQIWATVGLPYLPYFTSQVVFHFCRESVYFLLPSVCVDAFYFHIYVFFTHLLLDKMAAVLADDIFKCILENEKLCILIKISLKFVPKDSFDNNPAFCSGSGLAPNRRQATIWTSADPIHWRIYAALGGDELIKHYMSLYQMNTENWFSLTASCWEHGDVFYMDRGVMWLPLLSAVASTITLPWPMRYNHPGLFQTVPLRQRMSLPHTYRLVLLSDIVTRKEAMTVNVGRIEIRRNDFYA